MQPVFYSRPSLSLPDEKEDSNMARRLRRLSRWTTSDKYIFNVSYRKRNSRSCIYSGNWFWRRHHDTQIIREYFVGERCETLSFSSKHWTRRSKNANELSHRKNADAQPLFDRSVLLQNCLDFVCATTVIHQFDETVDEIGGIFDTCFSFSPLNMHEAMHIMKCTMRKSLFRRMHTNGIVSSSLLFFDNRGMLLTMIHEQKNS